MRRPTRLEVNAALDLLRPPAAPAAAVLLTRDPSYARERARAVADAATTEERLRVLAATDGAWVALVIGLASSLIGRAVAEIGTLDGRREAIERVPSVMRRQVMEHVQRVFAARRARSLRPAGGADAPCSKGQSEPGSTPRRLDGARKGAGRG